MAGGPYDSSLTRVQPFFLQAFERPGWLGALLKQAPHARIALGDTVDDPGEMLGALLSSPHPKDKAPLPCFEYEVAPDKNFLRWCVEHPDRLSWPPGQTYSVETTRMRRALLFDEPPGRETAQRRALEEIDTQSSTTRAWWRFEGSSWIDCVIQTDRLVVTVEGKRTEPLSAATNWLPQRAQLVRNLEAARQLARGRAWGTLLLSETPVAGGARGEVAASLDDAAPHADQAARAELQRAYLGNLTWRDACEAVGVPLSSLPDRYIPHEPL